MNLDLRVMSPTSYQAALLRDIDLIAYIEYHSRFHLSTPETKKSAVFLRQKLTRSCFLLYDMLL